MKYSCEYCDKPIVRSASRCPHCGRPGWFPNVRDAQESAEQAALESRYGASVSAASARGLADETRTLQAMLESTVAVVARSVDEVLRLAKSDNELYATFYQQTESGSRLPDDNEWDILRACADDALFPGYKKEIRFGSLSVDGLGISRYGDCYLVLANDTPCVFMKTAEFSSKTVVRCSIMSFARTR